MYTSACEKKKKQIFFSLLVEAIKCTKPDRLPESWTKNSRLTALEANGRYTENITWLYGDKKCLFECISNQPIIM